jgi:hypothetical protein
LLAYSNTSAISETEPNNVWNTANPLSIGANGTGTCTATGDEDWWRISSASDGNLNVACTVTNALNTYFQLFDTLGTIYLTGNFTSTSYNIVANGLAAGTYYLRIVAYTSTQSPTYNVVPSWTSTGYANDAEPNNTKAQAKTLPLNGSKVGHISYYFNNTNDDYDWYKITTTAYGNLSWTITSHNGQNVYAQLFDSDGTTYLGGNFTPSSATYYINGIAAGVYYVRISTFYTTEYAPYTISNSFTGTGEPDDVGNNDYALNATAITINDTVRGHIGYRFNGGYDDLTDWYKFTTTDDGYIQFRMYSLNGQNVYLQMFYDDTVTYIAGNYTTSTGLWSVNGIKAGTYYLRVANFYNSEFAPYKFVVNTTPAAYSNDTEDNGTVALAGTIGLNDSIVGRIGFYNRILKDTFDYRKITLTQYGSLTWTISSQNGQNVYAQLLDVNGSTYIAGNYTTSTTQYNFPRLAPGTYYILVRNFYTSEYSPYYLKTQFTPILGSDTEPNQTQATAKSISLNTTLNGCFGYYTNGAADSLDWLKFTIPHDGKVVIKLENISTPNSNKFLEVFDENGSNYYSQFTNSGILTFTKANLRKGTYYVRIRPYYANEFSQYQLTVNHYYSNNNDAEPNDKPYQSSMILGYGNKNGNMGYNDFTKTDTVDWFKVGHWNVGALKFTLRKIKNPDNASPALNFKLYSDTSAAPLYDVNLTSDTTNLSYTLAKKVYYIKLSSISPFTHGGYNIYAEYKDTLSHQVNLISSDADTVCNSQDLVYTITRGKAPYEVQLYKDGLASGSPVVTSDTAKFLNIDAGYYFVRVRSTWALSVSTYKQSTNKSLVPKPVGVKKANVQSTSAKPKWTGLSCADGFRFSYKKQTDTAWIEIFSPAGTTQAILTGLTPSTKYLFKVAAFIIYNSTNYYSENSIQKSFTTLAPARELEITQDENNNTALLITPNPASNLATIHFDKTATGKVELYNLNGQLLLSQNISEQQLYEINLENKPQGIYLIKFTGKNQSFSSRLIKE